MNRCEYYPDECDIYELVKNVIYGIQSGDRIKIHIPIALISKDVDNKLDVQKLWNIERFVKNVCDNDMKNGNIFFTLRGSYPTLLFDIYCADFKKYAKDIHLRSNNEINNTILDVVENIQPNRRINIHIPATLISINDKLDEKKLLNIQRFFEIFYQDSDIEDECFYVLRGKYPRMYFDIYRGQ